MPKRNSEACPTFFTCGFTRTLAWLCERYDCIVFSYNLSSYHGHTRFRINPHSTEYQGTPCLKPG